MIFKGLYFDKNKQKIIQKTGNLGMFLGGGLRGIFFGFFN
jgi:hypothetical protein